MFAEESTKWTVRGAVPDSTVDRNSASGAVETALTTMYPVFETVLLPPEFVAVSVTVYVPAEEYVCTGCCSVELPPSPNDQTHEVGEFVDESMNWTLIGTVPEVTFEWNNATGVIAAELAVIYPLLVTVSLPAAFDAVSVTVYVPAEEYVCTGFCSMEVPPSPNDQTHEVGIFVVESMNWTFSGMFPELTFEINTATGTDAAPHAGMNTAPRIRRRLATASLIRAFRPFGQEQFLPYDGFCNTAPSERPLLSVIIYDASIREVKYSP
jgi:hypothetical protein